MIIYKCGGIKPFNENIHSMVIEWLLTYNCNYRCNYCYEPTNIAERELSLEQTMEIVKFIKNIPHYKTITLLGGEPTCNPYFKDIVKALNTDTTKQDLLLCVFSNGSQSTKTFLDTIDIYDRSKNVLLFSYHPVKTDDDQFLIKIKTLHDLGFSYKINAMMEMNQYHRLQQFYDKVLPYINNTNQLIEFVPLEPFSNYTYPDEYKQYCKNLNNNIKTEQTIDICYELNDNKIETYTQGMLKFLPNTYFNFKDMYCAAWSQLGISPMGQVSTRCNISPKRTVKEIPTYDIFNQSDKVLQQIMTPIICPFDTCPRNDVLCSLKSKSLYTIKLQ